VVHWFFIISNDGSDCGPDAEPDPDYFFAALPDLNGTHGCPEQHALSGLHVQRPWF
jgi:hypothetical protein